jgi:hypothetical protein
MLGACGLNGSFHHRRRFCESRQILIQPAICDDCHGRQICVRRAAARHQRRAAHADAEQRSRTLPRLPVPWTRVHAALASACRHKPRVKIVIGRAGTAARAQLRARALTRARGAPLSTADAAASSSHPSRSRPSSAPPRADAAAAAGQVPRGRGARCPRFAQPAPPARRRRSPRGRALALRR